MTLKFVIDSDRTIVARANELNVSIWSKYSSGDQADDLYEEKIAKANVSGLKLHW